MLGQAEVGQWYRHLDKGEAFQVTAIDARTKSVEVQYFDGDLDEIDEATWSALPLQAVEQPEDWTGPVDDVDVEDLGYSETEMTPRDWRADLEPIAQASEQWEDAVNPEERDAEGEGETAEPLAPDVLKAAEKLG